MNTIYNSVLLSSANIDNDKFNIAEYYLNKLSTVKVEPITALVFSIVVILIFSIKFSLLYKFEKNKGRKGRNLKNAIIYISLHVGIEFILAYIIGFCLIKFTMANPNNVILNFVLCPGIGSIIANIIDNKFIIPLESNTDIGNLVKSKKGNSGKDDKKESDKSESGTVQNINISIDRDGPERQVYVNKQSNSKSAISNLISHKLDTNIADDDNFNEKIIDIIEEIKNNQIIISNEFSGISGKIESMSEVLENLRTESLNNKKVELKRMIYECLNQGYAKPEQNDKITVMYQAYIKDGGNGEIKALYEHHYLLLDVHKERRKNRESDDKPAEDRRNSKEEIEYGKYDELYKHLEHDKHPVGV